jgi:hypothetical protein
MTWEEHGFSRAVSDSMKFRALELAENSALGGAAL